MMHTSPASQSCFPVLLELMRVIPYRGQVKFSVGPSTQPSIGLSTCRLRLYSKIGTWLTMGAGRLGKDIGQATIWGR